jgi:hypothetical protein
VCHSSVEGVREDLGRLTSSPPAAWRSPLALDLPDVGSTSDESQKAR